MPDVVLSPVAEVAPPVVEPALTPLPALTWDDVPEPQPEPEPVAQREPEPQPEPEPEPEPERQKAPQVAPDPYEVVDLMEMADLTPAMPSLEVEYADPEM